MLLIDGVKYEEWRPDKEVEEFHPLVKEHYQDIFGKASMFMDGSWLKSETHRGGVPDGFVLSFGEKPQWYIVEIELSKHQLYDHIVNQVGRFINGVNPDSQKRIIDAAYRFIQENKQRKAEFEEAIGSGEVFKFLTDVITGTPVLTVIIEQRTPELDDALNLLRYSPIKVVEFRTFTRVASPAVHAHLFEPLHKRNILAPVLTTPIKDSIFVPSVHVGKKEVTINDLIEANIVKVGQIIHRDYKGQRYEGKVLNDGGIELAHTGKKFPSINAAAKSIAGSVNAWYWWYTTQENCTQCLLKELREKFRANYPLNPTNHVSP